MSDRERLEADIIQHVDDCVKDYAGHVDDTDIAGVLRNVADRYDTESE